MFQSLQPYAQNAIEFVRAHEEWAAPIAFALAFAESLVFISLLVPTWAALIGIGALIGAGDLKAMAHLDWGWLGSQPRRLGIILAGPQSGGSHCRGVAA